MTDLDGYLKEFSAKSTPLIKADGGHILAQGGKVTPLQGQPPNPRIVIVQWDSMAKLMSWYNSPESVGYRKIADKYATVQNFAIEGLPQ